MTFNDSAAKLLNFAKDGLVNWESLARECIAQMNSTQRDSVLRAFGLDLIDERID